jgi:predicted porin
MKKTIVAAAVAALVAAPAAFAEVSISGQINVEFSDNDTGDSSGDYHSDVVLKGSEDLGNGMKAGFVYHLVSDGDGNDAGAVAVGGDTAISLSGDFGTINLGRMEPFVENKLASVANIDASEELDLEFATGGAAESINAARSDTGIKYVSPNMNGLTIGVEAYADENVGTDDWDTTAVYASYSVGGLTVQVASENNDEALVGDTTAYSIQYKMGDISVRAVNVDLDSPTANDDAETTVVGASYTMGNNEFAIGSIVDAKGTNVSAQDGDTIYSLKHSLSKSTSVYLVHFSDDSGTADQTLVGMKHSF